MAGIEAAIELADAGHKVVLVEREPAANSMRAAIVSRIKIMCSLDIAERRKPQDGKFQIKLEGRQVDFRVSVLPTVHGEKVVMRTLDKTSLSPSLSALGLDKSLAEQFLRYMGNLLRGDLGPMLHMPGQTVNDVVARTLPVSIQLGVLALALGAYQSGHYPARLPPPATAFTPRRLPQFRR